MAPKRLICNSEQKVEHQRAAINRASPGGASGIITERYQSKDMETVKSIQGAGARRYYLILVRALW